jgi:hypothetical protein
MIRRRKNFLNEPFLICELMRKLIMARHEDEAINEN